MSTFTKMFSSIITSSIWSEPHHVVRVWITLLAIKDMHGRVEGVPSGLARVANVTLEECHDALAKFLAPDLESKDLELHPERQGRRIEKIPGGWQVLNHEFYRDLPGGHAPSMTPEAVRKRRERSQLSTQDGQNVTGRDVTVTPSASASVSESVSKDPEQKPVRREVDEVRAFVRQHDFGDYEEDVLGFVRAQRSPRSVLAIFASHLNPEDGERQTCNPLTLGRAVQEYVASGEPRFIPAYFAGFVRGIGRSRERHKSHGQGKREDAAIKQHQQETTDYAAAAVDTAAMVEKFRDKNLRRYEELRRQAEALIPKNVIGRGDMINASLATLVRREINNASS